MINVITTENFLKYTKSYRETPNYRWLTLVDGVYMTKIILNRTIILGESFEYITLNKNTLTGKGSDIIGIFIDGNEYVTDLNMVDGTTATLDIVKMENDQYALYIDTSIKDNPNFDYPERDSDIRSIECNFRINPGKTTVNLVGEVALSFHDCTCKMMVAHWPSDYKDGEESISISSSERLDLNFNRDTGTLTIRNKPSTSK